MSRAPSLDGVKKLHQIQFILTHSLSKTVVRNQSDDIELKSNLKVSLLF